MHFKYSFLQIIYDVKCYDVSHDVNVENSYLNTSNIVLKIYD